MTTPPTNAADPVQWDGTAEGATPIIDAILRDGGTARYHHPSDDLNGAACIVVDQPPGPDSRSWRLLPGQWVYPDHAAEHGIAHIQAEELAEDAAAYSRLVDALAAQQDPARLRDVLRVVLNLHRPVEIGWDVACHACTTDPGNPYVTATWPCTTVKAVADAWGVAMPERPS